MNIDELKAAITKARAYATMMDESRDLLGAELQHIDGLIQHDPGTVPIPTKPDGHDAGDEHQGTAPPNEAKMPSDVQILRPKRRIHVYHSSEVVGDHLKVKRRIYLNAAECEDIDGMLAKIAVEVEDGAGLDPIMLNHPVENRELTNDELMWLDQRIGAIGKQYPDAHVGVYRLAATNRHRDLLTDRAMLRGYWNIGSTGKPYTHQQQVNYINGQIRAARENGHARICLVMSHHYRGAGAETPTRGFVPVGDQAVVLGAVLRVNLDINEVFWWYGNELDAYRRLGAGRTIEEWTRECLRLNQQVVEHAADRIDAEVA